MLRPYKSLTIHLFVVFSISTAASSLPGQDVPVLAPPDVITEGQLPNRIAFGSCGHQSKPMPILRQAIEKLRANNFLTFRAPAEPPRRIALLRG